MFKGLFDEQNTREFAESERRRLEEERRTALRDRARRFDLTSLDDSREDAELYEEVLGELLKQTTVCQENFSRLVGHVSKSKGLRASRDLADRMIEFWKTSPNKKTTAQMLHFAALTNDAALYRKSFEAAADYWQRGRLVGVSANDLYVLMDSEYWVLSSEARRGGAGFLLKESLAEIRKKLKN